MRTIRMRINYTCPISTDKTGANPTTPATPIQSTRVPVDRTPIGKMGADRTLISLKTHRISSHTTLN